MRRFLGVALLVFLSSCGDDNGGGPNEEVFEGTWTGDYTSSADVDVVQAVLQLSQNGDAITGTLETNTDRSASVTGSVSGDRLDATFTYTDGCDGTGTITADLIDETIPPSLTGSYTATDCLGQSTGDFDLLKQ